MNYNVLYCPSKQMVIDPHAVLYNANDALTSVLVFQNILNTTFLFQKKVLIKPNLIQTYHKICKTVCEHTLAVQQKTKLTLSATDVLAPTTMKNAAKCDTSCELRNPVSHQNFERILHFLRGVCLLECLFITT